MADAQALSRRPGVRGCAVAPCFQRHVAVGKVGPSGALLSGAVSSCGSAHLPPRQGAPGLPKPEVDLLCPGTRAGRPPSFLREARGGCSSAASHSGAALGTGSRS